MRGSGACHSHDHRRDRCLPHRQRNHRWPLRRTDGHRGPTLLADDFFHAGFVLGAANPGWRALPFGTLDGAIEIDGARISGNTADTLDPLTAIRWLARKLAESGTRLRAGEIVLTGSFTLPVPIALPVRSVTLTITGFEPLALSPRQA